MSCYLVRNNRPPVNPLILNKEGISSYNEAEVDLLKKSQIEVRDLKLQKLSLNFLQTVSLIAFIVFTIYHSNFSFPSLALLAFVFCIKWDVTARLLSATETEENLIFMQSGQFPNEKLSNIEKVWKKFVLELEWISKKIKSLFKKNVFLKVKECEFIAASQNRGRIEDIDKFVEPIIDPTLTKVVKEDLITVSPRYQLYPFSRGSCAGSCLHFAKSYFINNDIKKIAESFVEGAPFEAVNLHGKCIKIGTGHCDVTVNSEKMAEAQIDDLVNKAAIHAAGLTVLGSKNNLDHDMALKYIKELKNGVYNLIIPVYYKPLLGAPWREGRHALLLIKEDDSSTLFDPNYGTGKVATENTEPLVSTFFKKYNVDFVNPTSNDYIVVTELGGPSQRKQDMTWGPSWDREALAHTTHGDL